MTHGVCTRHLRANSAYLCFRGNIYITNPVEISQITNC